MSGAGSGSPTPREKRTTASWRPAGRTVVVPPVTRTMARKAAPSGWKIRARRSADAAPKTSAETVPAVASTTGVAAPRGRKVVGRGGMRSSYPSDPTLARDPRIPADETGRRRRRRYELQESIEQPTRWRAHSGRRVANRSPTGCSS